MNCWEILVPLAGVCWILGSTSSSKSFNLSQGIKGRTRLKVRLLSRSSLCPRGAEKKSCSLLSQVATYFDHPFPNKHTFYCPVQPTSPPLYRTFLHNLEARRKQTEINKFFLDSVPASHIQPISIQDPRTSLKQAIVSSTRAQKFCREHWTRSSSLSISSFSFFVPRLRQTP